MRCGSAATPVVTELKKLVDEEVASGNYASASELIREGLRLLIEERSWRAEVRQKIAEGMAQVRAGLVVQAANSHPLEVVRVLHGARGPELLRRQIESGR
jgi:putative addiction module CopG family antidote